MTKKTTILQRIIFMIYFIFACLPIVAQEEREFNIDPDLYSYYQSCQENIEHSNVLLMADTLFHRAESKKDSRMQAVALTLKLDYYYFKGTNEDSIIEYVNKVKAFAVRTEQLKYYYFVWNNRLILHYLKTGKTNLALYQAQEMLKDAQKKDSKEGLLYCYNSLYQIYEIKDMTGLAIEYCLKGIDLTETYHVDNYNLSTAYAEVAKYYVNQNRLPEALELLKKSEKTANSEVHAFMTKMAYLHYDLALNDVTAAQKLLQQCKQMIDQDKKLEIYRKIYYENEFFYYKKTGQYQKALEAVDKQIGEELRLNEHALRSNHYRMKGDIYLAMGKKELAADCLTMYIQLEDSIKQTNNELATSGFATLVNMEKLNADKKELMLKAQEKELHNKQIIIVSLMSVLLVGLIFLYRENRLNKRLLHSEEELKVAKDKAESVSQMKTLFIQGMSHEIRTPLNSIVGFSQILGDRYLNDPETKEYASIIETNSNNLLRLVTDVLELSNLDKAEIIDTEVPTEVNDCCRMSMDSVRSDLKEGVELIFKPACEELILKSNPERIMQVLVNLLHNAAKFTFQGSITLAYVLLEKEQRIRFTITDTGIGIPVDKRKDVFERFSKLDSYSQGTGLGLSICKEIAEKLNGVLTIDEGYVSGCRFAFEIPYNK